MNKRLISFFGLSTILVLLGAWNLVQDSSAGIGKNYGIINTSKSVTNSRQIAWDNYENYTIPIDLGNSTAIFNSIYAALRQGASDIHPVGLSYFPAIIPKGTLMYHAGDGKIPEGLEWLATDVEFSLNFGSRRQAYGRASLHSKQGDKSWKAKRNYGMEPQIPPNEEDYHVYDPEIGGENDINKKPIGNNNRFSGPITMMTFRATRDLNKFVYVDGASAAKTTTGEMDTQQMLSDLIAAQFGTDGEDSDHNMAERLYAQRICKWGKRFGLDGIVRVEVGFELILCDFLNGSTELVSNVTFPLVNDALGLPPPTKISVENGWPLDESGKLIEDELTNEQQEQLDKEDSWEARMRIFDSMEGFDQLKAGHVHDKGDRRIQIDYRYLVTGINRTYINPDPNNRRLLNDHMTLEKQYQMFYDLEDVLRQDFDSSKSTDWQQVFDEIVDKFAPIIKPMANILGRDDTTAEIVAENVTKYTSTFVRRFTEVQIYKEGLVGGSDRQFAVYQFTRPLKDLTTEADYLIWSAGVRVVREIVDTIYDIHDLLWPIIVAEFHNSMIDDTSARTKSSQEKITLLLKNLNWISLNYKCERQCNDDEICYIPSWGPSPVDRASPSSKEYHFGMHFDSERQRQVIDGELKCVNPDFVIKK